MKALITVSVLSIVTTMLTTNIDQANAVNGNDFVVFQGTGSIVCPTGSNSNDLGIQTANLDLLYGSPGMSAFGISGQGRTFDAYGVVELIGQPTNPTGFIFRGQTVGGDGFCNGSSRENITVNGPCTKGSQGTFEVADGRKGEFTMNRIQCLDGCPSNTVISASHYDNTGSRQIFCSETADMPADNNTGLPSLEGKNLSAVEIPGQVKPNPIPQP